jgi:hypothetical protein
MTSGLAAPGQGGAFADFRDSIYFPAVAVVDGVNPYDFAEYSSAYPDTRTAFPAYLPHHLTLHGFLVALPFEAAAGLYGAITLCGMFLMVGFALRLSRMKVLPVALLGGAALLVLSFPGRANLVNGQSTAIVGLGMMLTYFSGTKRPWLAGVGVALSLIKPQFGVPFLAILLLTRLHAVAWRGMVVAAALSLPVIVRLLFTAGWSNLLGSMQATLEAGSSLDLAAKQQVDVVSSIAPASPVWLFVTVAVAVCSVAAWIYRRLDSRFHVLAVGGVFAGVLLVLHHTAYDLIILTWPATALLRRDLLPKPGIARTALGIGFGLVFFNPLALSYLRDLIAPGIRFGVLFTIGLLVVFVVYFIVAVRARPSPATANRSPFENGHSGEW